MEQREPTPVYAPDGLRYPIVIRDLLVQSSAPSVARTQPLFTYTEQALVPKPQSKGKHRGVEPPPQDVRTFLSAHEGELATWCVLRGTVIKNAQQPILRIHETCTHPIQLGGLCGICGKDLTKVDFMSAPEASHANIKMDHSRAGLMVNLNEASRLERETAARLRKSRKLSLIVDLDQTIIHATVDPTVGEWMADSANPNYDALADVSRFQLAPEPAQLGRAPNAVDNVWYYVKPRPGLIDFLREVSQLYEMHVYTMGTRSYATEICKVIDPEGVFFGERVLSRDESGNMTHKSLTRLFPCDTSMVVVIDDRGDVWDWSPNLLKVVPYDFFVGIGDINAAFLPPKTDLDGAPPPSDASTPTSAGPSTPAANVDENAAVAADDSRALQVADEAREHAIVEQIHDRPLQRKQEALQASHTPSVKGKERAIDHDDDVVVPPSPRPTTRTLPTEVKPADAVVPGAEADAQPEAVLHDNDDELTRILGLLRAVHADFYVASGGRGDVKHIIPALKRKVLAGIHVLFSGVIPLDVQPDSSGIWRGAVSFGATCSTRLGPTITHVVSAKPDTAKVNAARRRSDVFIVWTQWLLDCMALWRRVDEAPYAHAPPASNATLPRSPADRRRSRSPSREGPDIIVDPSSIPSAPTSALSNAYEMDAETRRGLSNMNWADVDKELEEALDGEDDETDDMHSMNGSEVSEDVGTDDDLAPRSGKRPLSDPPTPSVDRADTIEDAASPLVKRRRIAAKRRSKLKVAWADGPSSDPATGSKKGKKSMPPSSSADEEEDDDLADLAALVDA